MPWSHPLFFAQAPERALRVQSLAAIALLATLTACAKQHASAPVTAETSAQTARAARAPAHARHPPRHAHPPAQAGIPRITERLLAESYTEAQLADLWSGNVLRLLRAAEQHRDKLSQASGAPAP